KRDGEEGQGSQDWEKQAADDDEKGIANREAGHQLAPPAGPLGATSFGCTFSPSRNWLRFPTTTRSPSFRPDTTSTRDLPSRPRVTLRSATVFCGVTMSTVALFPLRVTASSGRLNALGRSVSTNCVS